MTVRILALDTTTEGCSVALWQDGVVSGRFEEVGRGHAERILSMVEAVLAEAGTPVTALDAVAACVGPGAFTGVRISVAVAQGLAFGAQVPAVAITSLEALACKLMIDAVPRVLAVLDARMGEVYWGCFAADERTGLIAAGPSRVGSAANVAEAGAVPFDQPYRGIGRGFATYPTLEQLPGIAVRELDRCALPDARDFVGLGALRLRLGQVLDPADLQPTYLRDKVAQTELERAASLQSRRGDP